jgi:hypothetical protein
MDIDENEPSDIDIVSEGYLVGTNIGKNRHACIFADAMPAQTIEKPGRGRWKEKTKDGQGLLKQSQFSPL